MNKDSIIFILSMILSFSCSENNDKPKLHLIQTLQCFKMHHEDRELVIDSTVCYEYTQTKNHYTYTEKSDNIYKIFDYYVKNNEVEDDDSHTFWDYKNSINLPKYRIVHFFFVERIGSTREGKIIFLDKNYSLIGFYTSNYQIVRTDYINSSKIILTIAKNIKKKIIMQYLQNIDTTKTLHDLHPNLPDDFFD